MSARKTIIKGLPGRAGSRLQRVAQPADTASPDAPGEDGERCRHRFPAPRLPGWRLAGLPNRLALPPMKAQQPRASHAAMGWCAPGSWPDGDRRTAAPGGSWAAFDDGLRSGIFHRGDDFTALDPLLRGPELIPSVRTVAFWIAPPTDGMRGGRPDRIEQPDLLTAACRTIQAASNAARRFQTSAAGSVTITGMTARDCRAGR